MIVNTSEIKAARILIVDDQTANVQLLEQLLQEDGYSAVTSTVDPQAVVGFHVNGQLFRVRNIGLDG